jgi:uncharacterized membrane protein
MGRLPGPADGGRGAIPLTNYLGWLLVSTVIMAILNRALPRERVPSAPAAALYLWVYFSSVMGHAVFFLPGSAITGAVLMGAIAVPFAVALVRRRGHGPHMVAA